MPEEIGSLGDERQRLPLAVSELDAVLPAVSASVLCLVVVSLATQENDR